MVVQFLGSSLVLLQRQCTSTSTKTCRGSLGVDVHSPTHLQLRLGTDVQARIAKPNRQDILKELWLCKGSSIHFTFKWSKFTCDIYVPECMVQA